MLVIVRDVTASSEEAEVVAAGQEIEVDLKDLLEYVLPVHTINQLLTRHLDDSAP